MINSTGHICRRELVRSIGTGQPELVLKRTQSKNKLVFKPLPDPRQRQPDISLAKEVLGRSPITALEQDLERTFQG